MLSPRDDLERSLAADLGLRVIVSAARLPLKREALSTGELQGLARISTEPRATEWLRGRAALRSTLGRSGADADTSRLRFPHARYSLTHAGDLAVAAGLDVGEGDATSGIGVDLERGRTLRAEAARFFLATNESRWLASVPVANRSDELLRLWTVKEALFKADPRNAPRTLREYRTLDPGARTGGAIAPEGALQRYTTRPIAEGFLSVAITRNSKC